MDRGEVPGCESRVDLDHLVGVEKRAPPRDDEAADLTTLLAPEQRKALLAFLRTLTTGSAPEQTHSGEDPVAIEPTPPRT